MLGFSFKQHLYSNKVSSRKHTYLWKFKSGLYFQNFIIRGRLLVIDKYLELGCIRSLMLSDTENKNEINKK